MSEDPVEREFIHIMQMYGIEFTRPERDKDDPRNLDFYLPKFKLYVEVKQFSSERIHSQIDGLTNVMALVGLPAVRAFGLMIKHARYHHIYSRGIG